MGNCECSNMMDILRGVEYVGVYRAMDGDGILETITFIRMNIEIRNMVNELG